MFKYKQNEKGEFVTDCHHCGEIFTGFSLINIKTKLYTHIINSKLQSHELAKEIAHRELDEIEVFSKKTKREQRERSRRSEESLEQSRRND